MVLCTGVIGLEYLGLLLNITGTGGKLPEVLESLDFMSYIILHGLKHLPSYLIHHPDSMLFLNEPEWYSGKDNKWLLSILVCRALLYTISCMLQAV